MMTYLIIAAAFLGVAALVGGVAVMFRGPESTGMEDRLDLFAAATIHGKAEDDRTNQKLLSQPLDDRPGALEELVSRFFNIRALLQQADVSIPLPKFVAIMGGLAAFGVLGSMVFRANFALGLGAGLLLATLPLVWVVFKRKKRLANFNKQLPDALELIARALRAGHSLAAGFNLVADEMSEPICKEFGKVYEAQNLGVPLEQSLNELTERVPNLDLRFFATAVILQRQTGGDLAEILDKIGKLIRERFKLWGQIQALTGEGRLSGIVLLALPPVLFIVMLRLNYDYVMMLFTDPLGKQMLAFALVMQLVGALVIRKIINIKV
jgi:tight adherence protein B